MVFQLRFGYNNPFVLYPEDILLFPYLITNMVTPVFEKPPVSEKHFRAHKAYRVKAATLTDTGMDTIYKVVFLENCVKSMMRDDFQFEYMLKKMLSRFSG